MSLIPAYVVGMYIVCCLLEFVTFKFLAFGILMLLTGWHEAHLKESVDTYRLFVLNSFQIVYSIPLSIIWFFIAVSLVPFNVYWIISNATNY